MKKVKVKGEDVPIKTVTLEDNTTKAKVTLWRDASSTEVHPGDLCYNYWPQGYKT